MPKSKKAKKIMKDFKDQYGEEEGEKVYHATANKQNRDPDTFKKESLRLVDDVIIEYDGKMITLQSGSLFETVGSGAIALIPAPLEDEEEDEEVEEASNSQLSNLQQDH